MVAWPEAPLVWSSWTVDNEKLRKYVISFGHQMSSDEPIGHLFLFSEMHAVEINQTLRGKKKYQCSGNFWYSGSPGQEHQAPEISTIVSFFCPVRNGWAFEYSSRKKFSSVQSLSCVRLFATPWTALARPPCPSPTPRAYSNTCLLSWWCHLTISSFVVPFSSCLQSFPASGSFPMSIWFASGGQSIGISASTSVLPMNIRTNFL